jgi:hypothetical protein
MTTVFEARFAPAAHVAVAAGAIAHVVAAAAVAAPA